MITKADFYFSDFLLFLQDWNNFFEETKKNIFPIELWDFLNYFKIPIWP